MKIFLIKPKHSFVHTLCKQGFAVPLLLLLTIIISQTQIFMSDDTVPVGAVEPDVLHTVTLTSDRELSGDEAWVMIDGEKATDFDGTAVVLNINKTSVIEIFSESKEPFTIAAEASETLEIFGEKRVFECVKGINFICRCHCPIV